MTIPIIGEKKIEVCPRCRNYGYYEIGISGSREKAQMFCACLIGQNLKRMKIQWEFTLLNQIAEDTHARLRIIKNSLHEPNKASKFIDVLLEDIGNLQKRTHEALNNPK